ncbi:phage integrase family protein [Agrobacterium vitis]|nr:phage integrase family protein [Agrobacterium vitis]
MTFKKIKRAKLTRAEYLVLLRRHILPRNVVATKPRTDSPESEWCYGEERDGEHNCWLLEKGDEADVRRPRFVASFDNVVDVNGARLSDKNFLGDNLTKKIICIRSLTVGHKGKKVQPHGVIVFLTHYDWFIRWRVSLGLKKNRSIKEYHFDDFESKLYHDDIVELVPWRDRLSKMVEAMSMGKLPFDLFELSSWKLIAWEKIAAHMGVTGASISRSTAFRSEFVDMLASVDIDDALKNAIITSLKTDSQQEAPSDNDFVPVEDDHSRARGYHDVWTRLRWLSIQKVLSHDSLLFDPFREVSGRQRQGRRTSGAKRTGTLHPDDFFRLMKLSTKWIVDYADFIIEAADILRDRSNFPKDPTAEALRRREIETELNERRPEGFPPISLLWIDAGRRGVQRSGVHLPVGLALKYLQVAALILLMCFTARRITEVLSLKAGCIRVHGNELYLNSFILKTLQHQIDIPVPEVVRTTIDMLERMSASTRSETGEPWLFRVAKGSFTPKAFVASALEKSLNDFVNFNLFPPPVGATEWALASHQFRRGFAVFYYHGFENATIESLSLFLGHYDPSMTQIYVTEVLAGEIGRFRDELEARLRVDRSAMKEADWKEKRELVERLEEIVKDFQEARTEAYILNILKVHRGEEKPVGKAAPRIFENARQAREHAQAYVRIGSRSNSPEQYERSIVDEIRRQAFSHYLDPTPDRSSMCAADQIHLTDLNMRECVKLAREEASAFGEVGEPELSAAEIARAFSSAHLCLKCALGCSFHGNRMIQNQKLARLKHSHEASAGSASQKEKHDLFLQFEASIRKSETYAEGAA